MTATLRIFSHLLLMKARFRGARCLGHAGERIPALGCLTHWEARPSTPFCTPCQRAGPSDAQVCGCLSWRLKPGLTSPGLGRLPFPSGCLGSFNHQKKWRLWGHRYSWPLHPSPTSASEHQMGLKEAVGRGLCLHPVPAEGSL